MSYRTIISTNALRAALQAGSRLKPIVVDCRSYLTDPDLGPQQYQDGHLPGAVYAHLDNDLASPVEPGVTGRHPLPNVEALSATLGRWGIEAGKQVVAYDAAGGAIAARLWWLLRWLGHETVAVLDGGYQAWTECGGALERGETGLAKSAAKRFVAQPNPRLLASADEISKHNYSVLVDSREHLRFLGEEEPIDPIAGHIPGAINRPFATNLEGGRFRDPAILRAEFEQLLGSGSDTQDAVFYCGSGVTAAHNLLAMAHSGLEPARLYNESWSGWIATGRAVATGED